MGTPQPIDYVERWRRIVVARREQHDAACAEQGSTTDGYWARRAEGFQKFVRETAAAGDPFLDALSKRVRPDDAVLDVGAGTGRHTLPLAKRVRRMIALDPSEAMLRFLREGAESEGLTNVEVIEGGWPDAADRAPRADIVYSAHVLFPIEDIEPFLRALDAHTRRLCFLNLMARQPWFDRLGLWEAIHGEERLPQPTHIDAVNVLQQLGCYPNVEIAWLELPRRFESIDDAVERFAETVAASDGAERLGRLRDALAERLTPLPDGRLALPADRYPMATVWWEAGALGAVSADPSAAA